MGLLRRNWLIETRLLCAAAVAAGVVFAVTPLDMAVERVFYRVGADHWPLVFKDHWDRPRPRDVVEFGGTLHYTPAPWRGEGGSSFPCGHCSVGFLYASGWWVWKSRRPRWARASLALGLALGAALGLGRMAAGAHFLSDVIWSALLALGLAHVLYFHVLRLAITQPADRGPSTAPFWLPGAQMSTLLAVLGAALVLTALFIRENPSATGRTKTHRSRVATR